MAVFCCFMWNAGGSIPTVDSLSTLCYTTRKDLERGLPRPNPQSDMQTDPKTLNLPALGETICAYERTEPNPYVDGPEVVEIYTVGTTILEAWVDERGKVIHMGPKRSNDTPPLPITAETRLPVAELRAIAVNAIVDVMPTFREMRPSLHPLEDNRKRELYFFRWDDFSKPLNETEMPPFVQVAVHADGRIASYTNTL